MADDSDGEGFCADPFEDDSDGGDSCDYRCCYDEDDEGEWSCGAPCDEDDDDSNGEEICRDPYDDVVDDDDGEVEVEDALCHDVDDGESGGSLCDEDAEGEELSDDEECEGKGGEFGDDPCDDEDERDGDSEDLCEDPSNHDEGVGPEVLCGGDGGGGEGLCVSGFCISDDSDISDSDHSASELEETGGFNRVGEGLTPSGFDHTPLPGAFRMVVGAEDSDSDTVSTDSDYEDDYEILKRPVSRQAVEGLPEMMLSEEEATCGCAVCKDVFALGQCVVFLPCKHYFHGDCIRPWLAIRSTCPVCRYQLPTDDTGSGQRQVHQLRVLLPVDRQGASQQSGGGATTGRD